MTVIIGVDPHKQSHTAVAICGEEREVAKVTVRATWQQTAKLLAWAEPFGERTWAIESAGGLGYLLAQQLVDAGEHVVDVPPTLASRVRVLGTGRSDKNDPNDALSVAIAALRSQGLSTTVRQHTKWGLAKRPSAEEPETTPKPLGGEPLYDGRVYARPTIFRTSSGGPSKLASGTFPTYFRSFIPSGVV